MSEAPTVLAAAAGASRLMLSEDDRYAVAEIDSLWRTDYFNRRWEVPPILKVIELKTGDVVATANGWALGPPANDGELIYLEEFEEEYRYRIRSTARMDVIGTIEPPDGFWLPRAMLGNHNRDLVVVLQAPRLGSRWRSRSDSGRSERLFIAAVSSETLAVTRTLTLDATTSWLHGDAYSGIILSPTGPELLLAELPDRDGDGRWHVRAVDTSTMKEMWRVELPTATIDISRVGDVSPTSQRRDWRVMLGASDDGKRLVALHGTENTTLTPRAIHTIDIANGDVVASLGRHEAKDMLAGVWTVTPIPATKNVAALRRARHRESSGPYFSGLSVVDMESGKSEDTFKVLPDATGDAYEQIRKLAPRALAVTSYVVLVAPNEFDEDEMKALIKTPLSWHRDDRPRVKAYEEFLRQITQEPPGGE